MPIAVVLVAGRNLQFSFKYVQDVRYDAVPRMAMSVDVQDNNECRCLKMAHILFLSLTKTRYARYLSLFKFKVEPIALEFSGCY